MPHVKYFWDEVEDNVVREYDENNNTIAQYTTEPTLYGSVLSQDRGGQVRHYHFDGQGNTTELTDENGNVTDTRTYSAFGEVTESTGTTEFPYQWGGRWGYHRGIQHESVSIRRRVYDDFTCSFRSLDPAPLISRASDNGKTTIASAYSLANNNPINYADPTGLFQVPMWVPIIPPFFEPPIPKYPTDVGIGVPGQCQIRIVGGHNLLPQYPDLRNWLNQWIWGDRDFTGCGHWFGAVGCWSTDLLDTYPPGTIVPGLPTRRTGCTCREMIKELSDTLKAVTAFELRLCRNAKARKQRTGRRCDCGHDFAWCESVKIVFRCDQDLIDLLQNGDCPPENGIRVKYHWQPRITNELRKLCGTKAGEDVEVRNRVCSSVVGKPKPWSRVSVAAE